MESIQQLIELLFVAGGQAGRGEKFPAVRMAFENILQRLSDVWLNVTKLHQRSRLESVRVRSPSRVTKRPVARRPWSVSVREGGYGWPGERIVTRLGLTTYCPCTII